MSMITTGVSFILLTVVSGQSSTFNGHNTVQSKNSHKIDQSQGCVINDFKNGLEGFNYNAPICAPFPKWIIGNFSTINIESPDPDSSSFITTLSDFGCISSTPFRASGGTVEINVYLDGRSSSDVLQALLMRVSEGTDSTVASAILSPAFDADGWHTLKMVVPVIFGDFDAYIVLLGAKSEESILLVDSFKYNSKTVAESSCTIYKAQNKTSNAKCVTFNFEQDFDLEFSTENYLCNGYTPWSLNNYTSTKSPDGRSSFFISPREEFSCISSSVFRMEPNGVIEATVYIEPKSSLDHIIVIGQKVTSQDVDTVVGFTMYYPVDRVFVTGWNVLSFPVVDFSSFDGYLILFGKASEGSTVLVDSIRYIPPSLSSMDESCSLY